MSKAHSFTIVGLQVGLRPLRAADLKAFYRGINDAELARWMLTIPHPYPKTHAVRFWLRSHVTRWRRSGYHFAITELEPGEFVGMAHLLHVNWADRSAEIACWLDRRHHGRGLGSEAIALMCQYGFSQLGLHKIWTSLFAGNEASRRLTERCGFTLEGRIRDSKRKDGRWQDELRYGLLREDWDRRAQQQPLVAGSASHEAPPPQESRNA